MTRGLIIRGVPERIRLDGWWLETTFDPQRDPPPLRKQDTTLMASLRTRHVIPLLAALVALADWLFWAQPVGISFAVFVMLVSIAILAMKREKPTRRNWGATMGFAVLSNLPVVIELQFLSVAFSLGGLIALTAWVFAGRALNERLLLKFALRLPTVGATRLILDILQTLSAANYTVQLRQQATAFLLPLLMGAAFLGLFANANPVLEAFFDSIDLGHFLEVQFWSRVLFWVGMASLLWPLLNLSDTWIGGTTRANISTKAGPHRSAFLVNPLSVRNSLWLFNLLFSVQTLLDLSILTGGMTLPEGMSYASYAHRGAYPLVATALLAGLFTMLTRHLIGRDKTLRFLVYLWLGQNMFLVATAAIRLQQYVDAYALTYLRVAAFIWMALVLTGLVLTVWQIHRSLSTAWLLRRCFAALLTTLYICGLVNFADIIARYNLNHSSPFQEPDTYYICSLGPGAYRAILNFEVETGRDVCTHMIELDMTRIAIRNWREWGYRMWRLEAYYQQSN